jgi:hypothetical protein
MLKCRIASLAYKSLTNYSVFHFSSEIVKKPISEVWFGGPLKVWDRNSLPPSAVSKQWFNSSPEFDLFLKETYEEDILNL